MSEWTRAERALNDKLDEQARARAAIAHLADAGHTHHCARRIVYGDGECECNKVIAGVKR